MDTPKTPFFYFEEVIYAVVSVLTLSVWTVVGLLFWIPFLARTIAIFMGSVLYSTFVGSPEHTEQIRRVLDYAVRFWFNGFRLILESIRKRRQGGDVLPPLSKINWQKLVLECLWALLFWVVTIGLLTGGFHALGSLVTWNASYFGSISDQRSDVFLSQSSGAKLSGVGAAFSPWYELCLERHDNQDCSFQDTQYYLLGDRKCGEGAECEWKQKDAVNVCFKFRLQGHAERPLPGQAYSAGVVSARCVNTKK